jgi:hypothetical protein
MSVAIPVLLRMTGAANTTPDLREEDTPVAGVTPVVAGVTANLEKARSQRAFCIDYKTAVENNATFVPASFIFLDLVEGARCFLPAEAIMVLYKP